MFGLGKVGFKSNLSKEGYLNSLSEDELKQHTFTKIKTELTMNTGDKHIAVY